MATLYYAFCDLGTLQYGCSVPVAGPPVSAAFTLSGSSQQSAAATESFVRVVTDTPCYLAVGANPDSTTATARFYLPANVPEYFAVGVGNKIAAST